MAERPRRLLGREDISAARADVPSADHEPSSSRVFLPRALSLLAHGESRLFAFYLCYLACVVRHSATILIKRGRTESSFLTLGIRLALFLVDFLALLALLDRFVAMISSSFEFLLPGLGLVAVIPWLRARIAIPKPRGNGDETVHALAGKGGVGQPIDSFLSGCPKFRIHNWTTQVLPRYPVNVRLTLSSGHTLRLLMAVRRCCRSM